MFVRKSTLTVVVLTVGLALAATATGQTQRAATVTKSAKQTASSATSGAPARAARTVHRFRGTVTATNRAHHWFRMRTTTNTSRRIYRYTAWDDCDWGDMRYGHHVDVRAYRSHGRWVATRMQNWTDWDDDWDD